MRYNKFFKNIPIQPYTIEIFQGNFLKKKKSLKTGFPKNLEKPRILNSFYMLSSKVSI